MREAQPSYRIAAFFIDIFIVSLITTILISPIPRSVKYKEAKEKNETVASDFFNSKIDEKEALETYYNSEYIMEKESIPETLIGLAVTIGYFVIFSFVNKGQTLGKKAMHIKIVSENGDTVSYIQLLGRVLIINGCFLSIAKLIVIGLLNQTYYLYVIGILGIISMLASSCSVIMISRRKDRRGLHDLLFKTKVIESK